MLSMIAMVNFYKSLNGGELLPACLYERENRCRWAVKEERKRENISPEARARKAALVWRFSASCGESSAQIVERQTPLTSVGTAPKTTWQLHPRPCVWQHQDTFVPSTPVSGWWHGPPGSLSQDWKTFWKTLPVIISISSVLFSSQMPALALHRWFCSDGPCLLYLRASLPNTVLIFFFTVPSGLFLIPSVFVFVFVEVISFSTLMFAFSVY